MFDVAVIGAGPVGSRVAALLAASGYHVIILDKKMSAGGPVCCTGIIGWECAESLSLDENVVFRQVNRAKLLSPSGKIVQVSRSEPQAAILNRPAFNVMMVERARQQGVELQWDAPVSAIAVDDAAVTLKVKGKCEVQARVVVVAAGFAAKLYGIPDSGKEHDFIMGAQAEVESVGIDQVEVLFGDGVAPGFFAWLCPTSHGKALVGLLSRRRPAEYLNKLLGRLRAEGRIASTEVLITNGGIPLQPLTKTFDDRMVIVGTAAGQVKPTTGGGIYYGLLCADIAAKHISRGLNSGDLSARSLSRYQRDWQKLLSGELRTGYWARKLYEYLNDRQVDHIFDIITKTGIVDDLAGAEDLSFDWHGKVIKRILADRALYKALMVVKVPFLRGKGNVVYNNQPERKNE